MTHRDARQSCRLAALSSALALTVFVRSAGAATEFWSRAQLGGGYTTGVYVYDGVTAPSFGSVPIHLEDTVAGRELGGSFDLGARFASIWAAGLGANFAYLEPDGNVIGRTSLLGGTRGGVELTLAVRPLAPPITLWIGGGAAGAWLGSEVDGIASEENVAIPTSLGGPAISAGISYAFPMGLGGLLSVRQAWLRSGAATYRPLTLHVGVLVTSW